MQEGTYLKGRVLENQEENQSLKNLNQELEKKIEKLKDDKKSQDERFKKIQSKNNILENKIAQIQKEASKLSKKQSQVEEVNSVIITDKKNSIHMKNKQQELLIDTPIINIILTNNGVKMNTQRRDDVRRARTTNQNTKQQTRRPIPHNDQIASIKIDLGWTTSETM